MHRGSQKLAGIFIVIVVVVIILYIFFSWRIRDESATFWYRIRFAVYMQMSESEIKTFRFGRVSRDFESEI